MYSIDELIETFSKHADEAEKFRTNRIDEYKKNYPGESLPEFLLEKEFNLSSALYTICKEIQGLKKHE